MAFSPRLALLLSKGRLPLKSDADQPLWNELISAFEANAATALAEVVALEKSGSFFYDTVTVNNITFAPSSNELNQFLGAMHESLMHDFDKYNRKGDTRVHGLVTRVRQLAVNQGFIQQSAVTLQPVHAQHRMGTGLVTTGLLTFLPDPTISGAGGFGSQPDQVVIANLAPMWALLKQRVQVKQATGTLGKTTHYVLAHLLNHQVNGSGALPANVVPFSGDGNKLMARQAESHLKQMVQMGLQVNYSIAFEPAVGMTPGRASALASCTTKLQRDIVTAEQYLPAALIITLSVLQHDNTMLTILPGLRIPNFVPETVPVT